MYRYERYLTHFESFYHNPETVSVAGKWVNTDLIENRFFVFLLKYNDRDNSSTDVPLVKV